MMMVGIIAAQAEQLLPIHAHGIRRSGIHQRVQLPIHCGEADAQSGIHQLAMQLLRGNEIITAAKLRHHGILLLRMPHRPVRHHTIEACSIDQFDAHIRGIAGWPLIQPKLLSPAVMVNVLGQHVAPTRALIADHPEWNVHDYGKAQVRHNRKMGHITVLTDDTAATVEALEATGCWDDLK